MVSYDWCIPSISGTPLCSNYTVENVFKHGVCALWEEQTKNANRLNSECSVH